jgi:hypothetical protein
MFTKNKLYENLSGLILRNGVTHNGDDMFERFELDLDAYHHTAQTGPCFICEIVAQNPDYPAHIVYEDAVAIAFLDKYPPLYGHTLIAPRQHS